MKLTYNSKILEYIPENDWIKIYSVPKTYSEDEFYVADYKKFSIEPIPASDVFLTKLLIVLYKESDTYEVKFKEVGVEYA